MSRFVFPNLSQKHLSILYRGHAWDGQCPPAPLAPRRLHTLRPPATLRATAARAHRQLHLRARVDRAPLSRDDPFTRFADRELRCSRPCMRSDGHASPPIRARRGQAPSSMSFGLAVPLRTTDKHRRPGSRARRGRAPAAAELLYVSSSSSDECYQGLKAERDGVPELRENGERWQTSIWCGVRLAWEGVYRLSLDSATTVSLFISLPSTSDRK